MIVDVPPPVPGYVTVCQEVVLCSVVDATAKYGWPHKPTKAEKREVIQAVNFGYKWPLAGKITCHFRPYTMGRVHCGVTWKKRGKTVARFRVNLRIFEDGSYVSFARPIKVRQ